MVKFGIVVRAVIVTALLGPSAAFAMTAQPKVSTNVASATQNLPASTGYDWAKILPPPPVAGGVQDGFDMEAIVQAQKLVDTPRWAQARADAGLNTFEMFGGVLGPDFTLAKRPEIGALMAYVGRYSSIASRESKDAFARPRPFITDPNVRICTDDKPGGSSYPSGHSSWGWVSAQILARIEPRFASQLLERGLEYGNSRVVCSVHFPTDVIAGRYMADALLVYLDNDPEYLRLLAVAKAAAKGSSVSVAPSSRPSN